MKWPRPPQYTAYERVAMRLLFAAVLLFVIPPRLRYTTVPVPNGLARIADLGFLLDPSVFAICRYVFWALIFLYVLRIALVAVLPCLTLFVIAVGSLNNSQGAIGHTRQIVALVLLAQTAAHVYTCLRRVRDQESNGNENSENRMVYWSQQAIAATYLTSALTKLLHTSGKWFLQSPLVALQIVKTTDQNYYNTLEPNRYGAGVAIAEWIVQHPLLVAIIMGAGLLLELTAPLMLRGRGLALLYGIALLTFHETVGRVMKLNFPFNEYLLWIYVVNVPYWAVHGWLWMKRVIQRRSSPALDR